VTVALVLGSPLTVATVTVSPIFRMAILKGENDPDTPPPTTEASEYKLFATEYSRRLASASMDIGGPGAQLRVRTKTAPMEGRAESTYRYTVIDTIGGGSSEIQKNIIARRALGLPKNF